MSNPQAVKNAKGIVDGRISKKDLKVLNNLQSNDS